MTDKQALNIDAIYTTKEINQAITLYEGEMCLKQSERPDSEYVNGNGAITFNWLPKPRIEYALSLESENLSGHKISKYSYLNLPNSTFEVFPVFFKNGDRPYCLGVLKHKNGIQESQKISYVKFHIANFHQYIGSEIFNSLSSPQNLSGRLRLTSCKWEVTIDSLSSQDDQYQELKMRGGYLITHVAKLEKVNREKFSTEEATEVLSALDYFLAFVRGLWAAPILPVGFDENDNCVWQLWEAPKVSSYQAVNSWFPTNKPHSVTHAFKGFMKLWNDPAQKNHLKLVIHWYVESNLQSGGIEGSIIMLQSAFELLYGLLFNSSRGGTARKLIELLKQYNLPTQHEELSSNPELKNLKLTIRNRLENLKQKENEIDEIAQATSKIICNILYDSNSDGAPKQLKKLFQELNLPIKQEELKSSSHTGLEKIKTCIQDRLKNHNQREDLVDILVRVRNKITHPKLDEDSQGILRSLELRCETWKVYLWYLEVVLLSLFKYEGYYKNRLKADHCIEKYDEFPPSLKA